MTSLGSANNDLLVSRNSSWEKLNDALRLFVGRGRRYSVKQLSNGTGVPDRVIECAMADPEGGDHRPMPFECILSIALFLGADFTTEVLAVTRQGAFDLPDDEDPNPGDLAIDASECTTTVIRAAANGRIDPHEKRDLRSVGHRDIARGMRLVKMARA